MAAINKMYLKDYYVFDEFRLWCLIHNPKLLKSFYYWNLTQQEWDKWKEEVYQSRKEMYDREFKRASTVELLRENYKKIRLYFRYTGCNIIVLEVLAWRLTLFLK